MKQFTLFFFCLFSLSLGLSAQNIMMIKDSTFAEKAQKLHTRTIKFQKEHEGWVSFHYGVANYTDGDFAMIQGTGEAEWGRSWTWSLGIGGKYRFHKTPLVLQYGIDFTRHRFGIADGDILQKTPDGSVFFGPDPSKPTEISQFGVNYIGIPLMLHLDFSKSGMDKGFTLGVGGYAGLRTRGMTRHFYEEVDGTDARMEIRNDFDLNRTRYGLMAELGYKGLKLSGGLDLNPLFSDSGSPDLRVYYIRLGIIL